MKLQESADKALFKDILNYVQGILHKHYAQIPTLVYSKDEAAISKLISEFSNDVKGLYALYVKPDRKALEAGEQQVKLVEDQKREFKKGFV